MQGAPAPRPATTGGIPRKRAMLHDGRMKQAKNISLAAVGASVLTALLLTAFKAAPPTPPPAGEGRFDIEVVEASGIAGFILCDTVTGEVWAHRLASGMKADDFSWAALGSPAQ